MGEASELWKRGFKVEAGSFKPIIRMTLVAIIVNVYGELAHSLRAIGFDACQVLVVNPVYVEYLLYALPWPSLPPSLTSTRNLISCPQNVADTREKLARAVKKGKALEKERTELAERVRALEAAKEAAGLNAATAAEEESEHAAAVRDLQVLLRVEHGSRLHRACFTATTSMCRSLICPSSSHRCPASPTLRTEP